MRSLLTLPMAGIWLCFICLALNLSQTADALEKKEDSCSTCYGQHDSYSVATSTVYASSSTTTSSNSYNAASKPATSSGYSQQSAPSSAGYGNGVPTAQSSAVASSTHSFQPSSSQTAPSSSTSSSSTTSKPASSTTSTERSTSTTSPTSQVSPSSISTNSQSRGTSSPESRSTSDSSTSTSSATSSTQSGATTSSASGSTSDVSRSTPVSDGSSQSSSSSSTSSSPNGISAQSTSSTGSGSSSGSTLSSSGGSNNPSGNAPSATQATTAMTSSASWTLTTRTIFETHLVTITGIGTTLTSTAISTVHVVGTPTSTSTPSGTFPTSQSSGQATSFSATLQVPSRTVATVSGPSDLCPLYSILPVCVSWDNALHCVCPLCYAHPSYCSEVMPSGTYCPEGWLCTVDSDPNGLPTLVPPPNFEPTKAATSTTTTLPWWLVYSTVTATDGPQTSDAPFNATLEYRTVTRDDGSQVIYPHREWKCIAGPLCFPIGFNFDWFNFICLFRLPPDCSLGFFKNWPKPRFPWPPPVGPASLDFELTPTTIPPPGNENGDPRTESTTTTTPCTHSGTYSSCSTVCATVTVSSSASQSCTSRCKTTTACDGIDTSTATTINGSACSISAYWNDPAIISSVSSMLADFPFSVDDTMPVDLTTTSASTSSSSSAPSSSSTHVESTSNTTPTSTPSSKTLSRSSKSSSSVSVSIPFTWTATLEPTPTTSLPSATATIDWPARSKGCHDYNYNIDEFIEYTRFPKALHNYVLCANEAEKKDAAFFWWDDAVVNNICDSMRSRNVSMRWDEGFWTSEEQRQDVSSGTSECYRYKGPTDNYYNEDRDLDIVGQIALDSAGCDFDDGGVMDDMQCKDSQCNDFYFASYSVDECKANFEKIHKKCQTKDMNGRKYTVGGTYFIDCMRWSLVAGDKKLKALPESTDDHPEGLGTGPQMMFDLGREGFWKRFVDVFGW